MASNLSGAFSQNPALLNMLQNRLTGLVGKSSGYVETLPADVKKRLNALKNVQKDHSELEAKFRQEVLELEKKYDALYKPLYEKRAKIVGGEYEPTEEESKYVPETSESEAEEEKPEGKDAKTEEPKEPVKGIPQFWLTALMNHPALSEMIFEADEPALHHLKDISFEHLDDNPGFRLLFHFTENEYFTNSTLTKTYYLQSSPASSYGDLIYDRAEGCEIAWKEGKNLSVRVETKKQRHKSDPKKTRVVSKTVPNDSFFNFFKPPAQPEEGDELNPEDLEQLEGMLQEDYEVGEIIKEKIIPHAVDWFTGKALQYEEFDEDEFDEDEFDEDELDEEDEDDDDDEDDEDGAKPSDAQNPECKQQ